MVQHDHSSGSEEGRANGVTRRQALGAATAGFFTSIAGCSSSGGGSANPTGSSQGNATTTYDQSRIVDKAFVKPMNFTPTRKQWNMFGEVLQGQEISFAVSELGGFHRSKGEWQARDLGKSYTANEQSLDLQIKENFTWQNGRDTLIDDLLVQWRLNHHVYGESGLWQFTDRIEKTGDYACTFHFNDTINPNVALGQILPTKVQTPRWVFRPYLEKLQEAQGEKSVSEARQTNAHEQAVANLRNFSWRMDDGETAEVVRTGPFQPVEQTSTMIRYELYPDHPQTIFNDGKINFAEVHQKGINPNNPSVWINDRVDGREVGLPASEDLPKTIREKLRVHQVPLFQSGSLFFNYQRKENQFHRRNVRKALQYVIDRSQVASNVGAAVPSSAAEPINEPTGLVGFVQNDVNQIWLENPGELTAYKQNNQAAELLRSDGFSKQNGTWHKPNGEPWTFDLIAASEGSPQTTARSLRDQLQSFGIEAQLRLVNPSTQENRFLQGDYDATVDLYGAASPYPYANYNNLWSVDRIQEGIRVPSKQEYEVPAIGSSDGSTETVNVIEEMKAFANATDQKAAKRHVQRLAWTWNQSLPALNIWDRGLREAVMGNPEWGLPPEDHDTWNLHRFGVMWIFQLGTIEALQNSE